MSTEPNSGPGWYEVIHPTAATTLIALVHEDGSIYLPEGDVLTRDEFLFAATRGDAHRLVRADSLRRTIPNTVEALEGLGAGTIIRHVEGLLWVKIADHLWAEGPQEPAVRTGTVMLSASADSSWVVIWDGGMWEGDDE